MRVGGLVPPTHEHVVQVGWTGLSFRPRVVRLVWGASTNPFEPVHEDRPREDEPRVSGRINRKASQMRQRTEDPRCRPAGCGRRTREPLRGHGTVVGVGVAIRPRRRKVSRFHVRQPPDTGPADLVDSSGAPAGLRQREALDADLHADLARGGITCLRTTAQRRGAVEKPFVRAAGIRTSDLREIPG